MSASGLDSDPRSIREETEASAVDQQRRASAVGRARVRRVAVAGRAEQGRDLRKVGRQREAPVKALGASSTSIECTWRSRVWHCR